MGAENAGNVPLARSLEAGKGEESVNGVAAATVLGREKE